LSAKPSLQALLEIQAYFGLPSPALVEKDWYVVQALAAISAADTAPLRLVFGGGTALSRTHRLIQRMSEDIDMKIVGDTEPTRPALRRLRDTITEALLAAGFRFDPANRAHRDSRNETRYTIYRLPYEPVTAGEGALRPEIQLETAVWPLRRPTIVLPVSSFVAEAFKQSPEVPSIACVSIAQTAAEKLVALTRRTAAEIADAGGPRDPTLVRHLYDLHVMRAHYDPADVVALAREIMPHDAEVFGNQFPAYRVDPLAETLRAIAALEVSPTYTRRYADFCRDMVYGVAIEYAACMGTLAELRAQFHTGNQGR
jgi:predicted nucleotidyltransferase component of viral defense system